jgi:hypothetical protein
MTDNVGVFNPLDDDFTVTYDINGDRSPLAFTVHSGEIEFFQPAVAEHIKKHLADKILNQRTVKTNWADDHEKIVKEISVEL